MKELGEMELKRKRKFLLVLPVLVLPFVTLLFVILGGGQGIAGAPVAKTKAGLKVELPGANFKDEPIDKMSYYNRAQQDSIKRNEMLRSDPNYQREGMVAMGLGADAIAPYGAPVQAGINPHVYGSPGYQPSSEALVMDRLGKLNSAINQPGNIDQGMAYHMPQRNESAMNKADVDRLENMMKAMQSGESADPEMQQIGGMLEQLLDLTHPERVTEKIRQKSEQKKGQVFSVYAESPADPVSLLQGESKKRDTLQLNSFYGLDNPRLQKDNAANIIKAVVHGTQVLVSGSELKMRLSNDIYINGQKIPKDQLVTGTVSLNGERLMVNIEQVQYRNALFPVNLSVHDLTGLEGIRIQGAISRDVAKQSGANVLQGLSLPGVDPSIGAQAASAGIEFTKSLIGRKTKLVEVRVKSGYQVLLKDQNQEDN